jgi:hypothetical protein
MAGRPPKLEAALRAFDSIRKSSDELVADISPFLVGSYQHGKLPLKRKQAERIVSFAFLTLVAGWEEFLSGAFLRYMMGASAPNRWKPTLIGGRSANLLDASRSLTGKPQFDPENRYYEWKDWATVIRDAKKYFDSGEPFVQVPNQDQVLLGYAQSIRNRVAHRSKKCLAEFRSAARPHLGLATSAKVPSGIDAGRLLSAPVSHVFAPSPGLRYYDAYSDLLHRMSRLIAP